jgi:hypothetical protein
LNKQGETIMMNHGSMNDIKILIKRLRRVIHPNYRGRVGELRQKLLAWPTHVLCSWRIRISQCWEEYDRGLEWAARFKNECSLICLAVLG